MNPARCWRYVSVCGVGVAAVCAGGMLGSCGRRDAVHTIRFVGELFTCIGT